MPEHGGHGSNRLWRQRVADAIRLEKPLLRECLAELLGTFILMVSCYVVAWYIKMNVTWFETIAAFTIYSSSELGILNVLIKYPSVFGNGSVAQTTLSGGESGNYLTIYWAYGMGVTMAVYVAGGVSGAHINPAVSLANCVIGRMPWVKFPFYVLSQFFGAFISAAVVYGIYYDALEAYDGGNHTVSGPTATGAIFATYPQDYLSITNGLFDQIFGTALLLCCILAINDERNMKPPKGLEPLLVGLLVFALGNSYGTNCGYAINPARDFGPRLFSLLAGWEEAFTAPEGKVSWWWVPIVGPCIGGVLGALTYLLIIELHWPPSKPRKEVSRDPSSTQADKDVAGCSDAENRMLMEQLHRF